ncbi:MAG: hypothetical protein ANABAC_1334 [Anaerolineae bacterium]|nr:MAG: hypothetical protein ANABAC_1334 [Anaerolineae bacterium]
MQLRSPHINPLPTGKTQRWSWMMPPEEKEAQEVEEEDPCIMTEDEWAEMLYYEGLEG